VLQPLSFWLIPTLDDREFFQQIIDRLAARYEAPRFTPHVTLYFGKFAQESVAELLSQVGRTVTLQGVELRVDRLHYTDQFTRTLFVQFHPQSIATQFSEILAQSDLDPVGFSLDPHLSLIYQPLDLATKQQLVTEIQLPRSIVRFDQLWAVSTGISVQTRADVESWQVLHQVSGPS
jgi:2'-5' RNA ligase superfamily